MVGIACVVHMSQEITIPIACTKFHVKLCTQFPSTIPAKGALVGSGLPACDRNVIGMNGMHMVVMQYVLTTSSLPALSLLFCSLLLHSIDHISSVFTG